MAVCFGIAAGADTTIHATCAPPGKAQAMAQNSSPPAAGAPSTVAASPSSPATSASATSAASKAEPASSASAPAADNLETSLRELHESLRRMKGDVDDILHEVTRTQEVYNNGVPVSSSPWANNPNYLISGGQVAVDSLSHAVYLPPRPHWLNNSLAQMLDLQAKVQAETANIGKILKSPACNSAVRAQGFVLSDVAGEIATDLGGLGTVIRENPPSNVIVKANANKVAEAISGMERVGDRLWKEAPRGLKTE